MLITVSRYVLRCAVVWSDAENLFDSETKHKLSTLFKRTFII